VKKIFLIAAIVPLLLIACKPKQGPGEYTNGAYPYDLKLEVDNGMIDVAWKKHGEALVSGYNIYLSEQSLQDKYPEGNYPKDSKPFNSTVFPGDTNPDDGVEHFIAEGLTNGMMYYVSVSVVNPDQTLSMATEELSAVPAPKGEITLAARFGGKNDGYAFFKDEFVSADHVDNDIYYYSRRGKHYLASPTRLDGFLRDSKLVLLPLEGDYANIRGQITEQDYIPSDDRIEVNEGDWVLLSTADSRFVLIQVRKLSSDGKDTSLFFAVSGLPENVFF
jgi:hypothetical protein